MNRKSSLLLTLASALLVLGLGAAVWMSLRAKVNSDAAHVAATDSALVAKHAVDSLQPASPIAEVPAEGDAFQTDVPERKPATEPLDPELADAIWIDGRVIFPEGTPIGEVVEVIATGRKSKTRLPYRARVESSGHFRAAFSSDTRRGSLDIDAAHLFLAQPMNIKLDDPNRPAEVVLEPKLCGRIGGRVLWGDGHPAVDASVRTRMTRDDESSADGPTVQTNAQGEFLIGRLTPGMHSVFADAKPTAEESNATARRWKATRASVPLETLDLRLTLSAGSSIRGRVIDDAGAPLQKFHVGALVNGERVYSAEFSGEDFTADDGQFELGGLLDGEYRVYAIAPDHDYSEPAPVSIPGTSGPLTLVSNRQSTISGIVLLPDGTPAARAKVSAGPANADGIGHIGRLFDGTANSAGTFKLKCWSTDEVIVTAARKGYASSEAWRAQLVPGASIENLRLVLRIGGRISGEVQASEPGERLGGSLVTCFGPDYSATKTDDAGLFVFEHLAPGEYELTLAPSKAQVQARTDPALYSAEDSQLHEALQRHATAHVIDGATTQVVFAAPLNATIELSGRVLRAGQPVPSVRVHCISIGDKSDQTLNIANSDASGRYQLKVSRPGDYLIRAEPRGIDGTTVGRFASVTADGLRDVDLLLSNGRVSGTIVGPEGQPIQKWIDISLSRRPDASSSVMVDGANSERVDLKFDFNDLPPGKYVLEVNAGTSFGLSEAGTSRSGDPELETVRREIMLGDGEQMLDLKIRLERVKR